MKPGDKAPAFTLLDQHGLGFPLLSDPDHLTAEAYGTWGEKTMYGKKT